MKKQAKKLLTLQKKQQESRSSSPVALFIHQNKSDILFITSRIWSIEV